MKILYLEDDKLCREALSMALEKDNQEIIEVEDPIKALEIVNKEKIDLIISDHNLPNMTGYEFLMRVKEINPFIKFIIVTAYGDVDLAVKSLKTGAVDFFSKPINIESLIEKIREIEKEAFLEDQIDNFSEEEKLEENFSFPNIIGQSKKIKNLLSKTIIASKTNLPVLIYGESGTGKELIADVLYSLSNRNKKPFIKVNCAAIPENLLESELFGYEKGAFTGASARKIGKIEAANKGIIFLDEIAEIPYNMQGKLLRFLQNSEIQRLGGIEPINIDVRIIAATNKDLKSLVQENKFREDLFFRLNGIVLIVPALRERKDDIPLLIDYFIDKYSKINNVEKKTLTSEAIDKLIKYDYPGNIRELENFIRYTLLFSMKNVIRPDEIPLIIEEKDNNLKIPDEPVLLKEFIAKVEKELIKKALERNNWHQTNSANELGISEPNLRYKMKKYDIRQN